MFETEDLKGISQGERSQGETNPASWSAWTPNQHDVIDRLLGRDADLRPTIALPSFRSDLGPALRARLEEELESVAQRYSLNRPLAVNKHHLSSVFHCEGFLLAEETFAWTLPKLPRSRGHQIRGRIRAVHSCDPQAAGDPYQPEQASCMGTSSCLSSSG